MRNRQTQTLQAGIALFVALSAGPLHSQTTQSSPVDGSTPPAIAPGQPVGSYALSGFETVNLFNGGLNFHLPLVTLSGRGTTGAAVILGIQRRWVMEHVLITSYNDFIAEDFSNLSGSQFGATPNYSPGTMTAREVGTSSFTNCSGGMYTQTLTRLTFTEADGTDHDFVDAPSGGSYLLTNPVEVNTVDPPSYSCAVPGPKRGKVWVTRDATFSTFISDTDVFDSIGLTAGPPNPSVGNLSGNLYKKDGTLIRIDGGNVTSIRDRNGNYVYYTYGTDQSNPATYNRVIGITDTLGRTITVSYATNGSTAGVYDVYDTINYGGTNGSPRSVKVHYCPLDPSQTSQTCPHYSGISSTTLYGLFGHQSSNSTNYNPVVVSFVELPDTRRYEFSYDSYGELINVKLPTGGAFQYFYAAGDSSGEASGVIGANVQGGVLQIYRRVTQRVVYLSAGLVEGQTIYTPQYSTSCPFGLPWCTTVGVVHQDPSGNVLAAERHWFYGGANDPTAYYESSAAYSRYTEGKEYLTEELDVSSPPINVMTVNSLRQENQTWEQRICDSGEACPLNNTQYPPGPPVDPRVKEIDTLLNDSGQLSSVILHFDRYNNIADKYEIGFGGSPSAILRPPTHPPLRSIAQRGITSTSRKRQAWDTEPSPATTARSCTSATCRPRNRCWTLPKIPKSSLPKLPSNTTTTPTPCRIRRH